MPSKMLIGGLVAAALALAGCKERIEAPTQPLKLAGADKDGNAAPHAGATVDVKTLQDGQVAFVHYCYACHGLEGDGRGPSAYTMRPFPRDFRMGLFKFAGTTAGGVPSDEALERTVRRGLQGTPMLQWDIPEVERKAIVQYIKTFKCVPKGKNASDVTSRFEQEPPGAPLEISPDPWKGKDAQATALGKKVYHVSGTDKDGKTYAGCSGCHAAYAPKAEIAEMTQEVTGEAPSEFRDDLYGTATRESEYALTLNESCEADKKYQVLPPDFLFNKVKTVWPVGTMVDGKAYTKDDQRTDLYRVIAAGIGGAAMPQWKGALPEEHLWALAYYVQSLINMRETKEAYALRDALAKQPEYKAPEQPEEKKAPEGEKKPGPEKKAGRNPHPLR